MNHPATPEITHALEYNHFSSAIYNRDFKGKGTLSINPAGPVYTFMGKPRGLFAGKAGSLTFQAGDITNVVVQGRTVLFKTSLGKSGKQRQPFAFHLRDAAEAATVVELFPRDVDVEFTEVQDFNARLAEVAGPAGAWRSPTNIIIALNVAVYVVMGLLGAGWLETTDLMPYVLYGANNGAATTDGEWWRLVTSMFMHYGIIHLLFNMWALFQAGHLVEKLLGRALYVLMYLGSGIAGGFASILWHGDQTWSAGASGAVFGVYGAIIGCMLRQKQALPKSVYRSLMKSTLAFAAYNILYGMARAGIDNAAHTGGLLGGIALGWLLALPLDSAVRARAAGRRLRLGIAALGVLMVAGISLTPRYDYSIRDILAWEKANQDFTSREPALLRQHQTSLAGLDEATDQQTYADWIEAELIPFYQDWVERLTALQLKRPGRIVETRDKLVEIFGLRLQSYGHLVTGLRANDRDAFDRFVAEKTRVAEKLTQLEQAAGP